MAEKTTQGWHLDKRVPLALIFAIVVQTGTALWYVKGLDARIEANSTAIGTETDSRRSLSSRIERAEQNANGQAVALGRIQVSIEGIQNSLDQIDRKLP